MKSLTSFAPPVSLQKGEPTRQGQLFANIAYFFVVMVILTLAVRGTSSATMPLVTEVSPYQGTVSCSFSAQGMIESKEGTPFVLPAGLIVESVPVEEGETIHKGDIIATFGAENVEKAIAAQQAALKQLQLQSKQLLAGKSADQYTVEQSQSLLNRAYEKYNSVVSEGEQSIADAQSKLENARNILNELQSQQPADPNSSAVLAMATPEQAQAANAYDEWSQKVADAQAELKQAEGAVETAKAGAGSKLDAALSAAQGAEDTRNNAQHTYEKESGELAKSNAADAANANVLQASIIDATDNLSLLNQIRDSGYCYTAKMDGRITDLAISAGTESTTVGGLLASADSGYRLTAQLSDKQAALLSTGAAVQIAQGSITEQATVDALSPDGEMIIKLKSTTLAVGAASVTATIQGTTSGNCLPITAIGTDNTGSFVYLIEEKNTVLGIQNVLVKLPVTVEEQGDTMVRVSGALSQENKIVKSSNKPLSAGAKVRIDE